MVRGIMGISMKDRAHLWALSRNKCAICGRNLVQASRGINHTVGEICHIVAKEDTGPRADPCMSQSDRDSFDNLIILCPTHHTLIDRDTFTYTVENLKLIKNRHEKEGMHWNNNKNNFFISEFDKLCNAKSWEDFTGNFLYACSYAIHKTHYDCINNFINFYRRCPSDYFEIEPIDDAFISFISALSDFISLFEEYSQPYGDYYRYSKFYKAYDYPESDVVFKKYDEKTTLLCNLLAELTRGVNLIIKRISIEIDRDFKYMHGYVRLNNNGLSFSGTSDCKQLHYENNFLHIPIPYAGIIDFQNTFQFRGYYFNLQG